MRSLARLIFVLAITWLISIFAEDSPPKINLAFLFLARRDLCVRRAAAGEDRESLSYRQTENARAETPKKQGEAGRIVIAV